MAENKVLKVSTLLDTVATTIESNAARLGLSQKQASAFIQHCDKVADLIERTAGFDPKEIGKEKHPESDAPHVKEHFTQENFHNVSELAKKASKEEDEGEGEDEVEEIEKEAAAEEEVEDEGDAKTASWAVKVASLADKAALRGTLAKRYASLMGRLTVALAGVRNPKVASRLASAMDNLTPFMGGVNAQNVQEVMQVASMIAKYAEDNEKPKLFAAYSQDGDALTLYGIGETKEKAEESAKEAIDGEDDVELKTAPWDGDEDYAGKIQLKDGVASPA